MNKYSGRKALIYMSGLDPSKVIDGTGSNTTEADALYLITKKAADSGLPMPAYSMFFSPHTGDQITLAIGDQLVPLDRTRLCKASADVSMEQGTIDVTDDCSGPYGEQILDGVTQISGSLSSFMQFDPVTNGLTEPTTDMLNKFFDIVEDDGAGRYDYSPKNDAPMYMFVNLNSGVKPGQREVWLLMPFIVSSLSSSWGLTDAQNLDMSWSKGEGWAHVYSRLTPPPPPPATPGGA
jgi:hypothetical protein